MSLHFAKYANRYQWMFLNWIVLCQADNDYWKPQVHSGVWRRAYQCCTANPAQWERCQTILWTLMILLMSIWTLSILTTAALCQMNSSKLWYPTKVRPWQPDPYIPKEYCLKKFKLFKQDWGSTSYQNSGKWCWSDLRNYTHFMIAY